MATIPPLHGTPETVDLSYGSAMSSSYAVRRIDFGDGYSQRGRRGLNSVRQQWQLRWAGISDTDAETLRVFFDGLAGVDIIDWKPYGQSATLKWTASGFTAQPSGFLLQDVTVTLLQEFDL